MTLNNAIKVNKYSDVLYLCFGIYKNVSSSELSVVLN